MSVMPPATPEQIAGIVTRIVDTWPKGPRGHIWTSYLTDLNATHATLLGVYEHLRNTRDYDNPPGPAAFSNTVRDITRLDSPPRPPTPTDTGPTLSLDEYLEQLNYRATYGPDTQAATDELACWARWRKRGIDDIIPTPTQGELTS